MKFYKILVFCILTFILSTEAHAQLLERDNVTSKIRVGTRPQQGDFGFLVGVTIKEIQDMINQEVEVQGIPLLSFKYYISDNLEARLNVQSYSKSYSIQGALVNQIGLEDDVAKESFMRFIPSVQYHFASSNLLDTYAGFGIVIGNERNEILTTNKINITGDYVANHMSKNTFVTGGEAYFGLQAFVADLPISIGAEATFRGLRHSNLQYENSFSSSVGGVVTDQNYYSVNQTSKLRYQSLEYKSFELGADLRFLLSYYFRR